MPYTKQYASMVEHIDGEAARKVFKILLTHSIGKENLITIERLSVLMYGDGSAKYQRQVRDLIENLRSLYFVPVMSDSGTAGRWLAKDQEEIDIFIGETENRIASLQAVIDGMKQAKKYMDAGNPQFKTMTDGQVSFI